jgi:hypothetical protein
MLLNLEWGVDLTELFAPTLTENGNRLVHGVIDFRTTLPFNGIPLAIWVETDCGLRSLLVAV